MSDDFWVIQRAHWSLIFLLISMAFLAGSCSRGLIHDPNYLRTLQSHIFLHTVERERGNSKTWKREKQPKEGKLFWLWFSPIVWFDASTFSFLFFFLLSVSFLYFKPDIATIMYIILFFLWSLSRFGIQENNGMVFNSVVLVHFYMPIPPTADVIAAQSEILI